MRLGSMVQEARLRKGFGLLEFARAAGIPNSYLCRIEQGARSHQPSVPLLRRLAALLELPLDEVFVAAGRVPPDVAKWILAGNLGRVRRAMRAAA